MSDGQFNHFPDGLPPAWLELDDLEFLAQLERTSLVRFPGSGDAPPRGIACLLHGDEDTGFRAVLTVLRRRHAFPFDLHVIFGNVRAALAGDGFQHRYLDDQEDMNRVWGAEPTNRIRLAAAGILQELREAKLTTMVDIHNNSGANPFYAILPRLRPDTINLATSFTSTLVHWELGVSTLMEALAEDCAAIAVECGLPGETASLSFALDGLRRYLAGPEPDQHEIERDFDLLGDLHKVVVRPEVQFSFGGELSDEIDFVVDQDADAHNFRVVEPGHVIGRVTPGSASPVVVYGPGGGDDTDQLIEVRDGDVVLTRRRIPVMMTRTVVAARKDCLLYLASPRDVPARAD